ncbi:MAG: SIS domain-containing protein [Nocardioidaceae bacterium]
MSEFFDDARLDDPEVLAAGDAPLRELAEAGARVRIETGAAAETLQRLEREAEPRAIVAAGADARLLRAVLEPWCPVPFVAWPGPSLPGWAGVLDLVVVLAPAGGDELTASAVRESVRRGCALITACPDHSVVADLAASRHSHVLPTQTDDSLAVAVVMLQALHLLGAGPEIDAEQVAGVLDEVAVSCSPRAEIGANPAKDLALSVADSLPLVWGGSVLAARAARRVAEAMRRTSGKPALAADSSHLLPVLQVAQARDVFADPFADVQTDTPRPSLLILDDGTEEASIREQRGRLVATAERHNVHPCTISATEGSEMARYAALLNTGRYAATYLGIGLAAAPSLEGRKST